MNDRRTKLFRCHLQVDERQLHNNVFLYDVCFPNLRDLRVPFYFVHGIPFYLYDLAKKLPRLEHLQLVESDKVSNEFPSKLTREQKMDKVIDKLWPRLPPSIQVRAEYSSVYINLSISISNDLIYH